MKTDLQKRLDENIPKESIETRSQAGVTLSYLSGAYVINRLNQVFGQGKWSYGISDLTKVYEGTLQNSRGEEVFNTSYIAQITLHVNVDGNRDYFTDVGYGDGQDKRNPGKAHELAVKEAVTDGLKRAAKNLGISMGLGLYFKDGDYEVDNDSNRATPGATQSSGTVSAGRVLDEKPDNRRKANGSFRTRPTESTASSVKRTLLREYTRNLVALRKTTADEIVKKYLGGKTKEEVTEEIAAQAIAGILTDFKDVFPGGANA